MLQNKDNCMKAGQSRMLFSQSLDIKTVQNSAVEMVLACVKTTHE